MKKIIYIMLFPLLMGAGCRKFLEVDNPRDKVVANYAYNSENSAIAVVTGIYYDIQRTYGQGFSSDGISINCGAASDELTAIPGSGPYVYYMNSGGEGLWKWLYSDVYKCNAAIEGLEKSEKLSQIVKDQLLGELKFTRAFLYFYLVNFFGDVPLLTSSNYAENSKAYRSSKDKIYSQIIVDLRAAVELLNSNYVAADVRSITTEKVRPNKAVARALLARVYLYKNDWSNAESIATSLINNSAYEISSDLDAVFLKNSKESIWQLQSQTEFRGLLYLNTSDARHFVLDELPDREWRPVWVSEHLEEAFENGDKRYEKWIGKTAFEEDGVLLPNQYHYPFKYRLNLSGQIQQEYLMVLRLAEQYLIRAEAKINNGNIAGGIEDLNLLRSKRSIGALGTVGALALLSNSLSFEQAKFAVEHERQVELFTEWGHRWLDLKRTGRIDQVMSALNPEKAQEWSWQSFRQYFPTPQGDRQLNENLGQTPGWPN